MNPKRRLLKFLHRYHKLYHWLYSFYFFIFHFKERQHRTKFGVNNPDKIFYVIRPRTNGIEGLMSLFLNVADQIAYAKEHGYIPVVDMKNYKTQYSDGLHNVWTQYFKPVSGYTLEEVYRSRNVILSGYRFFRVKRVELFQEDMFFADAYYRKCLTIMEQYIRISDPVLCALEKELEYIPVKDCIGVYIRGTDYVKLKPLGEHVQPKVIDVIHKINEFKKELGEKQIFLVTEDYDIYFTMQKYLGDSLYIASFDEFIRDYSGNDYLSRSGSLEEDVYLRGLKYFVKILLLSKCRYFIGSITRGSEAAYVFNHGEYEKKYIFNLGLYE